jgi:flavin-dependent dehydrogenase
MSRDRADVVVVGAGSSGAAVSGLLAGHGFRVTCLERRTLEHAGARWVNGVPRAAFLQSGIPLPRGDESDGQPAVFHLVAQGGRAVVPMHDVIEVDMRRLVARLQATAAAAGAVFREHVTVSGLDAGRLQTSAGAIDADWFIDASGLGGARLLEQRAVGRTDLCAAAQQVHEVSDLAAARAFFARHGVAPGEVLGLVGVAGGYSVLNVRLHHSGATMGILTGSIPALGFPSGKAMLDEFVTRQAHWVGPRVFGGSGAIALRRPYARLASDRVALIGEAGCQVFPGHGSGVGAGLIAARLVSDTLAAGRPLREYEVAWQRQHGGVFAFFDVFRRWNQQIDGDTLGRVMSLGLVDAPTLRAGIDQVLPPVSARALAAKVRPLFGEPVLASQLAAAAARSSAVRALYAVYPRRAELVPTWARCVDSLLHR